MKRLGPRAKRFLFHEDEVIVVVADEAAVVIGHGNGSQIGKATAERLAQMLAEGGCLLGVQVMFLACCWAGAGGLGERLHQLLGMELWCPVTPVTVTEDGVVRATLQKRLTDLKDVALYWHCFA